MSEVLAPLSGATLLGLAVAFLLGGFAKGALGFGLPLVTISILPYFVAIELALALNAATLLLMNIAQFVQGGAMADTVRRCWPLLGGLVLGVPLGATLVNIVDGAMLQAILGAFVMLFVLVSVASPQFRVSPRWVVPAGWGTGFVAGIIGALTTANGPILVMYLVGLDVPRMVFVASLAWLFLVTGACNVVAYWSIGILDAERLLLGVLCMLPAALGMVAGNRLADRLPASLFRRVVLGVLFVLGANLARRAIF